MKDPERAGDRNHTPCRKSADGAHTFVPVHAGASDQGRFIIHGICIHCQTPGTIVVPMDDAPITWME